MSSNNASSSNVTENNNGNDDDNAPGGDDGDIFMSDDDAMAMFDSADLDDANNDILTDNFSDPLLATMAAESAAASGSVSGSNSPLNFLEGSKNSLFDISDDMAVMPAEESSGRSTVGGPSISVSINSGDCEQHQTQMQETCDARSDSNNPSGSTNTKPNPSNPFIQSPTATATTGGQQQQTPSLVPMESSLTKLDEDGDILPGLSRTPSFHPVDGSPLSTAWEGVSLPRNPSRRDTCSSLNISPFTPQNKVGNSANATFGRSASIKNGSHDVNGIRGTANAGRMMLNMLDAKPLDISLGDSGMLRGRSLGDGSRNNLLAAKMRQKKNSYAFKGSLPKSSLPTGRISSVIKANMSASRLRSTMSDGMLARAIKARSQNQLGNAYINARSGGSSGIHGSMTSSRFARNAVSSMNVRSSVLRHQSNASIPVSRDSFLRSRESQLNEANIHSIGEGNIGGRKNATWGAPPAKRTMNSSSLFSGIISGSSSNIAAHLKSQAAVNSSSSSLMAMEADQRNVTHIPSSSSIQDMLRMSKQHTKNQTLIRQSSAQSLMQQSSQTMPARLDVSAMLRPNHSSPQGRSANNNLKPGVTEGVSAINQMMESSSLLHQSCRLYPKTTAVVESALRADPGAVRRSVPIPSEENRDSKLKSQAIYTYPINIAIKHGGSIDILRLLAEAGPDVLVMKDGTELAGSLSVALLQKCGKPVIDLIMGINPSCARIIDRRANFPLHTAVSNGASLEVVQLLYHSYPEALEMRNFHSETPLDIAQRSTMSPEEVTNFLQLKAYSSAETEAHHAVPNDKDQSERLDDIMDTDLG